MNTQHGQGTEREQEQSDETDIVQRLRSRALDHAGETRFMLKEAAIEIERLRGATAGIVEFPADAANLRDMLDGCRNALNDRTVELVKAEAEIERLRKTWQASIDDRGELLIEIEHLRKDLANLRFRGERGWP